MAKKSFKLVKASAALAVTAAALTPVMAAEASTAKAVELKAEVVLGGKFKEALALNTPAGVQITWGKHLVTAINKWQTVTGKGSDGKTYIKKLYARNYPLYVLDQDLGEVEAGSELVKPSIRVMYRDGKVYTQAPERYTMSSNYNTKDEGEQKVLISYNHNGNRVTKMLSYTVVAGEVEFENISASVNQATEVLSVNADVKNLKEGEKVELHVFANKNTASTPIVTEATVTKEGKLSVSRQFPVGTHSFQLVSGDVKSDLKDFTVEAAMVKNVAAINAKELQVTFNKPVDKTDIAGKVTLEGVTFDTPVLSEDGMVLTLTATAVAPATPKIEVTNAKLTVAPIKTKADAKVLTAAYNAIFSAADKTAASVAGVKAVGTTAEITFSEPVQSAGLVSVNGVQTSGSLSKDGKTLTVSGLEAEKAYRVDLVGVKDFAGNVSNPIALNFTVAKPVVDNVKPTVSGSVSGTTVTLNFSEELKSAGTLTIGSAPYPLVQDKDVKTKYTADVKGALGTATFLNASFKVAGFEDLAGNKGEDYTFTGLIQGDTTAPTFAGASAKILVADDKTVDTDVDAVYLTFSEKVDFKGNLNITSINGIVQSKPEPILVDQKTGQGVDVDGNGKIEGAEAYTIKVLVDLDESTSYGFSVDKESVKDLSGNPLASTLFFNLTTGKFVPATPESTATVTATVAEPVSNSTLVVTFSENMTSSALQASNYTLGGQALPAGTTLNFVDSLKEVHVKLPAGSVAVNGLYVFEGKNLVSTAGNTLAGEKVSKLLTLKENIAPVATKIDVVASNKFTVTFSENVTNVTTGIIVKVNGVTVTPDSLSISGNKLTVETAANFSLSDSLSVEFKDAGLADGNGNVIVNATITK
ncbi:Ig-like domain-containing protein [Exiguobacterium aurantiacum]|uniref:Outer cell wall protein n=1 Tax=Exiguobacterium aurantiacum TaxID=33987 RepID=A0A377FS05_9BACL|nr:Ig-like domain-containing protein [Exiguobacterium aurantiacum]STO07354.1 Outer cell wall protein precursor [Exiguobacterium aurantiacum]